MKTIVLDLRDLGNRRRLRNLRDLEIKSKELVELEVLLVSKVLTVEPIVALKQENLKEKTNLEEPKTAAAGTPKKK